MGYGELKTEAYEMWLLRKMWGGRLTIFFFCFATYYSYAKGKVKKGINGVHEKDNTTSPNGIGLSQKVRK